MNNTCKFHAVAAALTLLAAGLAASPAAAVPADQKSFSPILCQPRGPGTTISELTYGPYGITNPGSTNESVICPLIGDSEAGWSSSPGASAYLYVWIRTGAVSGSVSCSAFAGSAVTTASPTYSVTASTGTLAANTRSSLWLSLADTTSSYPAAPPTSLVCTLSPKAALGWVYYNEYGTTDSP